VSQEELSQAIGLGITKVNIGTDGRLIWTRVHREFFKQSPKDFDFMLPGRIYMNEYAAFVAAKCEQLKATGQADHVVAGGMAASKSR
jgi:fructose-bisphosphate aldolase, class II